MPIDNFTAQTTVPLHTKETGGMARLKSALSSLVTGNTPAQTQQFLKDFVRTPIKINGTLLYNGNTISNLPNPKEAFAALKKHFESGEITALHQGLAADLRVFLNENYTFNNTQGILVFSEKNKKLVLEKRNNEYSYTVKLPIYAVGLQPAEDCYIFMGKDNRPIKVAAEAFDEELPQYIERHGYQPFCTASLVATLNCQVRPPKASIKITVESNAVGLRYQGPASDPNVNIQIGTDNLLKIQSAEFNPKSNAEHQKSIINKTMAAAIAETLTKRYSLGGVQPAAHEMPWISCDSRYHESSFKRVGANNFQYTLEVPYYFFHGVDGKWRGIQNNQVIEMSTDEMMNLSRNPEDLAKIGYSPICTVNAIAKIESIKKPVEMEIRINIEANAPELQYAQPKKMGEPKKGKLELSSKIQPLKFSTELHKVLRDKLLRGNPENKSSDRPKKN